MCTAFIKKGSDILFGYNLDIDPAVWNYSLVRRKNCFTVAIKVGSTTYYTHGVNNHRQFGNLPYMNGPKDGQIGVGPGQYRIDLLNDRYIRNRLTYPEVLDIVKNRKIVNAAGTSMHSLIGDGEGHILLAEPGLGYREIAENAACAANFPILAELSDFSNPFYGKERYDKMNALLASANDDLSARDALQLLEAVKVSGTWGTKLSFVYSCRENAVYYCENGDFSAIERWQLA